MSTTSFVAPSLSRGNYYLSLKQRFEVRVVLARSIDQIKTEVLQWFPSYLYRQLWPLPYLEMAPVFPPISLSLNRVWMWVGIALAISAVSVLIIGAIYHWRERASVSLFHYSIVSSLPFSWTIEPCGRCDVSPRCEYDTFNYRPSSHQCGSHKKLGSVMGKEILWGFLIGQLPNKIKKILCNKSKK